MDLPGLSCHSPAVGETLASKIRRARELRGWTQQRLADELGVARETVGNWETGVSTPRNKEALLRQVLGLDLADSVGAEEQHPGSGVLLDLPEEALDGLSDVEREEVRTAARDAALRRAREIRGR